MARYKDFFGQEPNEKLWETPAQRFPNVKLQSGDEDEEPELDIHFEDPNGFVAVNVYRILAVKTIKLVCLDALKPEKVETSTESTDAAVKETKALQEQRFKAKKSNELFSWRKLYPNCNNIYAGSIQKNEGEVYFNNPYEGMSARANIFTPGGLLYLQNPFDESTLKDKTLGTKLFSHFYKNVALEKSRNLTLDHLADAALCQVEEAKSGAPMKKSKEESKQ